MLRQILFFFVRLAIAAGVFWYLYVSLDWREFGNLVKESDWVWMAAAMGAYGVTTALSVWRWHILLSSCHAQMRLNRTAQLTMIGLFANSFLPGVMSGDVVKIFYAVRELPQMKPAVVMSVVMERLLGFGAMFLVSTTLILTRYEALTREFATRWAVHFYFFFFALLLLLVGLMSWKKIHRFFPSFKNFPWQKPLREAGQAYHFFLGHPACFWGGLGISAAAHFSLMATFYFVSLALGMNLAFLDLAAVLPLVMLVTLIPTTPGAIGVREVAFQHFLLFAGMNNESSVALSLGGSLVILLWNLLGGLVYLQFRSHAPGPELKSLHEVK